MGSSLMRLKRRKKIWTGEEIDKYLDHETTKLFKYSSNSLKITEELYRATNTVAVK